MSKPSTGSVRYLEQAWTTGLAAFLQSMFESNGNSSYEFTKWKMNIQDKLSFEKHEQQQDSYNCGIITIMQSFMLGRYGKLDKLGIYGGHNEFNEIRKQLGAYIYKRCSNKTVLENAVNESILNANM